MSARPTRSASIPVPRASQALESVISLPFASPTRARLSASLSTIRNIADEHRGHGAGHAVRPTVTTSRAIHPNGRTSSIRGSPQTRPTVQPRVIRHDSTAMEAACAPSPVSTSPGRTRRQSTTTTGVRATSIHRTLSGPIIPQPSSPPLPIARPAYLEQSALRHILQPEAPASYARMDDQPTSPGSYSIALSDSEEESSAGTPPRELRQQHLAASPDEVLKLPTRWSTEYRHHSLTVSSDGRELSYNGASLNGDKDAAATRTNCPIPPACGIFYYEVDIHSKGQKAHISVGFSASSVSLSRLPGWERDSWGYHGDDGCSFAAEKNGSSFGPQFGLTDTIGCGIDFTTNRAFYTKNATLIGHVFENVGKGIDLYPAVGLQHSGESIRVNFGHEPFKYDIEFHVQQQRNQTWGKILHTPIPHAIFSKPYNEEDSKADIKTVPREPQLEDDEKTKSGLSNMVLSYLAHHGYAKTARALQAQAQKSGTSSLRSTDTDVEMDGPPRIPSTFEADIELRTRIVNSVVTGDIDSALEETRTHHPKVLEVEQGLMLFKLRCRKFVELVLKAAEIKRKREEVVDVMDVDDDVPVSPTTLIPSGKTPMPQQHSKAVTMQYEGTLRDAISYGQSLRKDYKSDLRPEVRALFQKTFGILAWDDPLHAGGAATEIASPSARAALATELNQAILRSQGKPPQPGLETLYRHTAVCVLQLGVLGNGAAAFADMPKEFLDA